MALNGSSPTAVATSLTIIPTGFRPDALAVIPAPAGAPADSSVVLSANAGSGTLSVIATAPQVVSATFYPSSVDVNSSTVLTVAITGGAGSSNISYGSLPAGCSSANSLVLACTPAEPGHFAVLVTVTDSLGVSATSVASLTVAAALSVESSIGVGPVLGADVGVPVGMRAVALGGAGAYQFEWEFGDGDSASGRWVNYTYSAPGTYVAEVTVTDATGATAVNETALVVAPDPTVVLAASPQNRTDVGVPVLLSASVFGGTGTGTGTWSFDDGTNATENPTSHSWDAPGQYGVQYSYRDALGVAAPTATLEVTVHPNLIGRFNVTWAQQPPMVGTQFTYTAQLLDGTPPFVVNWSFGDGAYQVRPDGPSRVLGRRGVHGHGDRLGCGGRLPAAELLEHRGEPGGDPPDPSAGWRVRRIVRAGSPRRRGRCGGGPVLAGALPPGGPGWPSLPVRAAGTRAAQRTQLGHRRRRGAPRETV